MANVRPISNRFRVERGELRMLLIDAFTPWMLEALLRELPFAAEILHELPPAQEAAPEHYASELVELLFKTNHYSNRLFYDALVSKRPGRRDEIRGIARALGVRGMTVDIPTPTLTQHDAQVPRREPTLSQWCRNHIVALLVVLLVPIAVSLGVWGLMRPDQFAADHSGASHTASALHAGQAVLAWLVMMCFASWPEPSGISRFSRHPADAEPHTPAGSAVDAVSQMRRSWFALWACWGMLYLVMFVLALLPTMPGRYHINSLTLALFNNGATAAFLAGFWILSYHRVPQPSPPAPAQRPDVGDAGLFGSGVVVLFLAAHLVVLIACGASTSPGLPDPEIIGPNIALRLLSGLVAAAAMAMYLGRLDSAFLGVRVRVLAVLYLYAAIQPGWPVIELFLEGGAPAPAQRSVNIIVFALFLYAWVAKLVFFAVSAWLYHSGRLEFYFLGIRDLHARIADEWHEIRRDAA